MTNLGEVTYAQTGESKSINEFGMRAMQSRALSFSAFGFKLSTKELSEKLEAYDEEKKNEEAEVFWNVKKDEKEKYKDIYIDYVENNKNVIRSLNFLYSLEIHEGDNEINYFVASGILV